VLSLNPIINYKLPARAVILIAVLKRNMKRYAQKHRKLYSTRIRDHTFRIGMHSTNQVNGVVVSLKTSQEIL